MKRLDVATSKQTATVPSPASSTKARSHNSVFRWLTSFWNGLFGSKSPPHPQSLDDKSPVLLQAFILEPMYTPSGLVDGIDETPDLATMDIDTPELPELGEEWDISDGESQTFSNADGDVDVTPEDTADSSAETTPETPLLTDQLEDIPFINPTFESGTFTVGETGDVSIDFLFDGGGYQGELAIFSLDGMDEFEPGSEEFIQEAASRALSDSELGHIVISDQTEGARFVGELGESDRNSGEYLGVKTVQMRPGDEFGFMLVPNNTVQRVFDNPDVGGAARPLFSMATANPDDAFHVGQIADVTGDGSTFVMEDLRVDTKSDGDYNDVIFRVNGATGQAALLDNLIDPADDWRSTELGQKIAANVQSPAAPGKELPGDPIHPALPEPTVPQTTVDQGGDGFSDVTDSSEQIPESNPGEVVENTQTSTETSSPETVSVTTDNTVEPNRGGALPNTPTPIESSSTQDVIDQVSKIDPTDIYRVSSQQLVDTEISVLSGDASVSIQTLEGEILSQQVLTRGTHGLTVPEDVSGDVLIKLESQAGSDGTYILKGFESKAEEPFNIDLEFEGLTASQRETIQAAAKSVESVIGQGLPSAIVDGKIIDDVNFKISVNNLDGVGGTLARTKVDFMRYGTLLPAQSITQFDVNDIAELEQSGQLFSVVQHEILHGLGFGNLWEAKGLVDYAGTPLAQYNGENAVAAFQDVGGLTDAIPLETEGEGSAGLHWHEQLFQDELMTADLGFQTGEEGETISPISPITLAALADLGYRVNLDKSTPGWGLLGGQQFNPDNLTKEQIKAFRQLTEESFAQPDDEFIYAIMPEVDPAKVSPEIWAHAERAPNGEYYDWVPYQVQSGDTFGGLALKFMGSASPNNYKWIADHNGAKNYNYLHWDDRNPDNNWIEVPRHRPNYEWEQEQERLRREEELRRRQEEEARRRREEEERLALEKAEQERKAREEEERRLEAERKQRELEEQERRLREEMERRRQEEERRKEEERLRELERQREIARQQGKGGQDWFFATPLPEFGPVDPFETKLTGETVGNLVPDDYYRFTLSRKGRIDARLMNLLADADLVLYDVRNRPISYSMREGITDEQILVDLIPGTYMLRVNSPKGVTTDYDLIVKFKHLLSRTEQGPPPGWRVGGGTGGSNGAAGPLFSDPRIQRIYDTALANFAGPERAKAEAKIADLQREKRSYEQEMQALLDKMNGEQRKKVHKALDDTRNYARGWVDNIANPIKNSVDSLGNGIKNKADSLASSLLSKIDNIWDLGNGWIKDRKEDARKLVRQGRDAVKTAVNNAQSWLKGQLTNIQNNVKSAISTFFNTIKNAYRTGGEINQIIANAANGFRSAIDRAVRGANELVGKFKGRVLSAVEWTKNLGINVNKFEFNAYNQVVKPAVNAIARGVSSTINGIGNSLKGITNWLEPRTQDAVAKIVNAILGDKTGHLWNKINGVDAKIAATRTGLEKAISAAKQHIVSVTRQIEAFLTDPEERKRVLEALWKWGFKTIEDAYNFIVKKRDEVRKEIEAEKEARRKAEEEEARRKEEEARRKAEEEAWLNQKTELTPDQEKLFKQVILRGNPQLIADYDFLKNIAQSSLTSLHTLSGVNLPKDADPLSKAFLNDPGTLLKKFSYMQILENKLGMISIEQAHKAYEMLTNAFDSYSFNDPVFENTVSSNVLKILKQNYSELDQITEKFKSLYSFNFGNALLDAANGIYRSIGLGLNLSRIFLEVKSGGFRTAKSAFEALPDLTKEQNMTEKGRDMYDLIKAIYETPILEALESALNGNFDKLFEQLPSLFGNTADLMSKMAKDDNIKISSSASSEFVKAAKSMESFGSLSRLLDTLKSSNFTHINSDDISFVSASKIYSALTTLFSTIKTFSALFELFFRSKAAAGINFAIQGKTTYLNAVVDVADSSKGALWSLFEEWNSSNMRIQNGMYSYFTEYNHSAIKAAQKAITYIAQAASSKL